MITRMKLPARLMVVFFLTSVMLLSVVTALADHVAVGSADGCTIKKIGNTQYVSCWNGKEMVSRQVPEYYTGAGAVISRQTGQAVWIPEAGSATSVRQVDDDQLVVSVSRQRRILFFRYPQKTQARLRLDPYGNVIPVR